MIGRWYKFFIHEGLRDSSGKSVELFSVIPSLIKLKKLFNVSGLEIIKTIPKENLVVIYGENDIYLFDREILSLKDKGFKIIEVKGAGHNYRENIDKAVLGVFD